MIAPYSEQYWNMARTFAYYGFRMRDQSTVLGFIWTLLHPLLLFLILFVLFRQRLGADIPNFAVYLLIGIVHWNMFANATNKAVNSLVSRRDMVVGMNFPRELIVFGDVGAALISSSLEFLVLILFAAIMGVPLSFAWLLVPIVFAIQSVLVVAVSLIVAGLQVFVRDVERIWSLLIRVGFFAVPIFYSLSILSGPWARAVILANPLTHNMTASRELMLEGRLASLGGLGYSLGVATVLLILGLALFRRAETSFAERL